MEKPRKRKGTITENIPILNITDYIPILNVINIVDSSSNNLEDHICTGTVSMELVVGLKDFGIDAIQMIKTAAYNEAMASINNDIIEKLNTNNDNIQSIQTNELCTIINNLFSSKNFAISNIAVISEMLDNNITPIHSDANISSGLTYKCGTFNDMDFYCNPMMAAYDTKVIIGTLDSKKVKFIYNPNNFMTIDMMPPTKTKKDAMVVVHCKYKLVCDSDDSFIYYKVDVK